MKGNKHMKKRILILLLAFSLVSAMSFAVSAVHTGIEETDEGEKIQVVQLLEIMNGDQYGNLNLDNTVTRAEFVKMIINASPHKDSAVSSGVSVFPDVTSGHWAAPYISAAVKNGYVNGYLDGTFRPENEVKLEEAVTVVLKMLGYTTSDFQGTYPDAQLAKYSEIDLDTSMLALKGQPLTRRECMKLIYNLLCTKTKNGTFYCQSALGYAVDADSETIDLDLLLEDKMAGPYVNTADRPWTAKVSFAGNANTTYYLNGKRVSSADIGEYDVYYYSDKARTVWVYNRKEFGKISRINPNKTSPDSFTVENDTTVYMLTAESSRRFLDLGLDVDDYVMMIFDKNDKVADIMLVDHELYNKYADDNLDLLEEVNRTISKPVIVSGDNYLQKIPFDINNAEIILDGGHLGVSDIKDGDVLYYSTLANSVWVYRETVSGLYSAVTPGKENPSAVVVGGKTYSLATDDVKYKFSNYGTFKTDTVVTLVLGKGDEVVDVKAADDSAFGDDDNQISYIDAVNATLKGPVVVKDASFEDKISINLDTAEIICDGEALEKADIRTDDVLYYSESFNSVWVFRETKSGVCTVISPSRENPAAVSLGGKTYSLSTKEAAYKFSNYGTLKTDMLVTLLLGKDGSVVDAKPADTSVIGDGEDQVSYTDVVNYTLKGPYIVKEDGRLPSDAGISLADAVIYKDNAEISADKIKQYNVYYYSKLLNTVWIYDDTKSGLVEAVSPNKVSPSSITLSGNAYALESESVKFEFSSMGSFKVGDRVTLLLGKDGNAAGVVKAGQIENKAVYGVVLSKGEKTYTDADGKSYISDTLTVFATDGEVYTYQTSADFDAGEPVMIAVGENKVNVTGLSSPKSQSYAVNAANAVKNGKFADDAQIIEYYDSGIYSTVTEARISGNDIWYTNIIYYQLNDDGEIQILILDNYTGDLVEYGLLTEVNGSYYEYITDGVVMSYSSGDSKFTVREGAAYFAKSGSQIKKIGNINSYTDIAVISGNRAYSSKNEGYDLADDVRVYIYDYTDYEYKVCELDELMASDYSNIKGYYDRAPSTGGKIRVITASR